MPQLGILPCRPPPPAPQAPLTLTAARLAGPHELGVEAGPQRSAPNYSVVGRFCCDALFTVCRVQALPYILAAFKHIIHSNVVL